MVDTRLSKHSWSGSSQMSLFGQSLKVKWPWWLAVMSTTTGMIEPWDENDDMIRFTYIDDKMTEPWDEDDEHGDNI